MTVIRTENFVVCDFCNEGADSYGGVLVGSTAICGNCSEKNGFTSEGIPNQAYEFKDEIWEMLDEESSQTGFSIPFNISNWNGCKHITSEDKFKNALARWSVEETCRKLLDEQEEAA